MKEVRKCIICNGYYVTTIQNAKYCSSVCRKKGEKEIAKQRKIKKKEQIENSKNMQQSIIDIAVLARQAGMTYGQYVAKMGL
jgi:hypothetical protein